MIKIKTSWNGVVGVAKVGAPHFLNIEGQTVAHAVSKLVKRLENHHKGESWQDDNGTQGIVGHHKPKKARKIKPSELPQLGCDGEMNGYRRMKREA